MKKMIFGLLTGFLISASYCVGMDDNPNDVEENLIAPLKTYCDAPRVYANCPQFENGNLIRRAMLSYYPALKDTVEAWKRGDSTEEFKFLYKKLDTSLEKHPVRITQNHITRSFAFTEPLYHPLSPHFSILDCQIDLKTHAPISLGIYTLPSTIDFTSSSTPASKQEQTLIVPQRLAAYWIHNQNYLAFCQLSETPTASPILMEFDSKRQKSIQRTEGYLSKILRSIYYNYLIYTFHKGTEFLTSQSTFSQELINTLDLVQINFSHKVLSKIDLKKYKPLTIKVTTISSHVPTFEQDILTFAPVWLAQEWQKNREHLKFFNLHDTSGLNPEEYSSDYFSAAFIEYNTQENTLTQRTPVTSDDKMYQFLLKKLARHIEKKIVSSF